MRCAATALRRSSWSLRWPMHASTAGACARSAAMWRRTCNATPRRRICWTVEAAHAHTRCMSAAAVDYQAILDQIPELAKVHGGQFGMAVVTLDGTVFSCGDARVAFSIQSVSKLFALTLAFQCAGDALWQRVGREPSGSAFNSLVQLETEQGKP